MQSLIQMLDRFTEWVGKTVSWLTLGMVLVTCAVVLMRRVLGIGSIALQESVTYMHAAVFLLGAGYALKHQALVRVDIFYRNFSLRTQAWVDSIGALVFLLPFCLFVGWICWDYVMSAWQVREVSADAGGLAFVYLHKTLILFFSCTLLVQAIAEFLRALHRLMLDKSAV